jgi:voltage-gated potassium channel Kch
MTGATRLATGDRLRFLVIALVLCEGGVHLQQYQSFLHSVPTINTLFLLNAVSAAVIALALAASRDRVAIFIGLSAIGMTVVALVSLAISRASVLFNYSEPTLRGPVLFATIVELAAVLAASAFIIVRMGEIAQRPGHAVAVGTVNQPARA